MTKSNKSKFKFKKGLDVIRILGKGMTVTQCPIQEKEQEYWKKNKIDPKVIEYWGCNDLYKFRKLDRLFIIHDLQMTAYNKNEPALIEHINKLDIPVYTLGDYNELKNNVRYPMQKVTEEFNIAYFQNTASYMLALAILQQPKQIELYGMDMSFGSMTEYMRNEKACLEFWLGVAKGRGITHLVTKESTLLVRKKRNNFYGFKVQTPSTNAGMFTIKPDYPYGCGAKCASRYKLSKRGNRI